MKTNSYILPQTCLCREGQLWKQKIQVLLNRLQEPEAKNVQVFAHETKKTTLKEGLPHELKIYDQKKVVIIIQNTPEHFQ